MQARELDMLRSVVGVALPPSFSLGSFELFVRVDYRALMPVLRPRAGRAASPHQLALCCLR